MKTGEATPREPSRPVQRRSRDRGSCELGRKNSKTLLNDPGGDANACRNEQNERNASENQPPPRQRWRQQPSGDRDKKKSKDGEKGIHEAIVWLKVALWNPSLRDGESYLSCQYDFKDWRHNLKEYAESAPDTADWRKN